MVDLEKVKAYARVDGTDEDEQIIGMIKAAELYLENAGAQPQDNELYILAVSMLVLHWYDNRNPVGVVSRELDYSLKAITAQLKYCDEEEEE